LLSFIVRLLNDAGLAISGYVSGWSLNLLLVDANIMPTYSKSSISRYDWFHGNFTPECII